MSIKEEIKAVHRTVSSIFTNKDGYYNIPEYQRPYSWGEEHVSVLFDDIYTAFKEKQESYFLGSTVLISQEKGEVSYFDIVDGQQRLTSLTILLAVTASFIPDSEEDRLPLIEECLTYKNLLGEEPSKEYPKLRLREADRSFFYEYIQSLKGRDETREVSNESQKKIVNNAKVFENQYEDLRREKKIDVLRFLKFLLDKCYLVVIEVSNNKSAFRVFNVLNTRGMALQTSDILKAELLEVFREDEDLLGSYERKWGDMEETLSREHFQNLFSHIRMIYIRSKAQASVVKEITEDVLAIQVLKKVPSGQSKEKYFLDEVLEPYGEAYIQIRSSDYDIGDEGGEEKEEIDNLLAILNTLQPDSNWAPVAIYILYKWRRSPSDILKHLRELERQVAYLLIVKENKRNIHIKRCGDILNKLENGEEVLLSEDEKKEFKEKISDTYLSVNLNRPTIIYLFRRLDMFLTNSTDSKSSIWGSPRPTIEHVLPQTIHPGWKVNWPNEGDVEEWTHSMGNLLLVSGRTNSLASNDTFPHKKVAYRRWVNNHKKLGAKLVEEVIVEKEWTLKELKYHHERRTSALSELWDLDSVSSSKR